ncbi:phosphoribosyltransferase family protein [Actinoplanes oblitus]|uniref:Phosphoribosyltransferase family protein n=1 Tax=Actinoplanes oblitus TaxID=3040509 RepID=A0ABY8WJU9_9ACTN|nr:phosphoribosyltransferase family protein [Actinoplanes oblitus]WIM97383.1 phosphoribosyltransferase family protein [Actinoplanes oblitus]
MTGLLGELADLVLPGACAGCGTDRERLRHGVCPACVAELEGLEPLWSAPRPRPPGFPPCAAVGPYAGALRGVLLAYKEKGRHRLARPLGALLAGAVAAVAPRERPVLIIPVPSTRAARRERYGDHMSRLTGYAVARLRAAGWTAAAGQPLRALPKPDSTSLDAAARSTAAVNSLRIIPARIGVLRRGGAMRGTLVVADDIVTTGATLAAAVRRLEEADMQVTGAAVLAATQLRRSCPRI